MDERGEHDGRDENKNGEEYICDVGVREVSECGHGRCYELRMRLMRVSSRLSDCCTNTMLIYPAASVRPLSGSHLKQNVLLISLVLLPSPASM